MDTPHSLKALEIEIGLLNYLSDQADLTTPDTPFKVQKEHLQGLGANDVPGFLSKLQSLKCIGGFEDLGFDHDAIDDIFEITPPFKIHERLKALRIQLSNIMQPGNKQVTDRVVWISYNEASREILLNDTFLLSIPHYGKANQKVFEYLYNNPNREVSKGELASKLKCEPRDLGSILSDLNFNGDLAKLFFSRSSASIQFHNPITLERLRKIHPEGKIRLFGKTQKDTETV